MSVAAYTFRKLVTHALNMMTGFSILVVNIHNFFGKIILFPFQHNFERNIILFIDKKPEQVISFLHFRLRLTNDILFL